MKVRVKHSTVIDINGVTYSFGKGAVINVSDQVFADNWLLMERVDMPPLRPEPKPVRAVVYETASVDRQPRTRKKVTK